MPKAKAVQPFVERIITMARRGSLHAAPARGQVWPRPWIHVWVADENVLIPQVVEPLVPLPGLKTSSLMIVAKW